MKIKLWAMFTGEEIETVIEVPDDTPKTALEAAAEAFAARNTEYCWEMVDECDT